MLIIIIYIVILIISNNYCFNITFGHKISLVQLFLLKNVAGHYFDIDI